MIKKIFLFIVRSLLAFIGLIIVITILFVNLSPEFGGTPTDEETAEFEKLDYFQDGSFQNLISTSMDMSFSQIIELIGEQIEGVPNSEPDFDVEILKIDSLNLVKTKSINKVIWFGHSAVLMQLNGKNILFDPMLGDVPAPHPLLGPSRYYDELPMEIEALPVIDYIFISHDHYDHLDMGSIEKLKSKTKRFYVPIGVGAHLIEWGVAKDKIHEMAWWDETTSDSLFIAFAPSRHFSGRDFSRNTTLWGSWIVKADNQNVYFSGDSGHGPHFKSIGEKYGPFDFAMLECGQYNEKWSQIHMMPEETAQAGLDINTKVMMPIHWGSFTLALHSWTDPVLRVKAKAEELNIPMTTPKIGEIIYMDEMKYPMDEWWVRK
jgi:L-ascorbate metabolism protein UlaG (beta-lactamase superfamily)